MKKRFKTRQRYNLHIFKIGIVIFLMIISFFYTIKFLFKHTVKNADEKKINELLAISTNNLIGNVRFFDIINFNLSSPKTLLKLNFIDIKELKVISKITPIKTEEPLVYIYNTHQSENYNPSTLAAYNITPTVYMASFMLKEALKIQGINALVEEEDIKKILKAHNWTYSQSYKASRLWLESSKINHPSVKYYIDIHRDSVSETVKINNVNYAKMMLVLGTNHKNYTKNEELANKIQTYLTTNYPNSIKNIRKASNNIFNQDFNENLILIEVGGPENTIEEVYNSINILAESLTSILKGDL